MWGKDQLSGFQTTQLRRKSLMRSYAVLAAIAIALSSLPVSAASGPKKTTATITGSVSKSNLTSGPCAPLVDANGTHSYDTMCPPADVNSCQCLSVAGLVLSGGFGKGTANLSATADEAATVVTGSAADACAPAFAVVTLSIPAKGNTPASTQTLNALGAICGSAGTTTVTALGGFSIAGSNSTPAASGSGTFNGTISTVGQVSVKLTGLITNP